MSDTTLSTKIQMDRGGDRLSVTSGGVLAYEPGSKRLDLDGVGTCSLGTTSTIPGAVNAVEERVGTIHRTVLTLTNVAVPTTDNTTNGAQGTWLAYTFPRGSIEVLGAVLNLTITGDGTNITATAAVVAALGTVVPATDATLTSTEANLAPSYAATLTGSAGVVKSRGVTSTFFDNTTTTNATQMTANLNFAIPDAGSSANGTITVSGTIVINWFNHGDN